MNQSQQASASGNPGVVPEFDYGREVVVRRVVAAPRDLVFRVWTDPVHLVRWWGPHGFTNPRCEADARPGGKIHIDMRGPDGTVYPMAGEYKEVVPPERLVFTSAALDGNGEPLFENLNIVTFAEERGGTFHYCPGRGVSRGRRRRRSIWLAWRWDGCRRSSGRQRMWSRRWWNCGLVLRLLLLILRVGRRRSAVGGGCSHRRSFALLRMTERLGLV